MSEATESKMKADVGPEDFGVPAEFAERARNFATFMASAERERCALVCDQYAQERDQNSAGAEVCAAAIRRGSV